MNHDPFVAFVLVRGFRRISDSQVAGYLAVIRITDGLGLMGDACVTDGLGLMGDALHSGVVYTKSKICYQRDLLFSSGCLSSTLTHHVVIKWSAPSRGWLTPTVSRSGDRPATCTTTNTV